MSTRRQQEAADAATAARRLAALAGRPGAFVGDPARSSAVPPADPPADPPAGDGFDWFLPAPVPTAGPAAVPVVAPVASAVPAGSPRSWRSLVAAAGVPVNAAIAVVLVVAAVVAGVVLRAQGGGGGVVDVAPRPVRASAGPGGGGGASRAVVPAATAGGVPSGMSVGMPVGGVGPTTTSAAVVVVDVVGKVRRPGLVRLPAGSRVADAVAAAGGATDAAVLPRINLARLLSDGEQVVVPDADDPVPAAPAAGPSVAASGGSGGTARTGPLDLNAATAADLDGLPGVGPVLAGRIVAWRAEHQRFTRVDELAEVAGIGDRLLERLRPLVRV